MNQPGTYGSGNWTAAGLGIAARPGATINVNGTLQACTTHPGLSQRALYTLTSAPGFYNLITLPFQALLPFSALAGAALLTFARIIRLGAEMDDEIKATV